jgi:peptide-methionine (R)-S-oxide reductase
MTRRDWLGLLSSLGFASGAAAQAAKPNAAAPKIEPLLVTDAEWKKRLTPAQYNVLREEGTERAFTSPLNDEKRKGAFHCAACDLALFTSEMKFDSGTGWPSFFTTLPGVLDTKRDFKHVLPRTEYHCARCGGHHGHVFDDGPKPSGLRYCNNGVALKFAPGAA